MVYCCRGLWNETGVLDVLPWTTILVSSDDADTVALRTLPLKYVGADGFGCTAFFVALTGRALAVLDDDADNVTASTVSVTFLLFFVAFGMVAFVFVVYDTISEAYGSMTSSSLSRSGTATVAVSATTAVVDIECFLDFFWEVDGCLDLDTKVVLDNHSPSPLMPEDDEVDLLACNRLVCHLSRLNRNISLLLLRIDICEEANCCNCGDSVTMRADLEKDDAYAFGME
jgi:hypothetical protein